MDPCPPPPRALPFLSCGPQVLKCQCRPVSVKGFEAVPVWVLDPLGLQPARGCHASLNLALIFFFLPYPAGMGPLRLRGSEALLERGGLGP